MDDRADATEASDEATPAPDTDGPDTDAPDGADAAGTPPPGEATGADGPSDGDPIDLGGDDVAARAAIPVRAVGLSDEQRRRLVASAPVELVEEGARLVVVSTRDLPDDPASLVDPRVPTVVVVGPGDEAAAARLLTAGAVGAVPEGEEGHALRAVERGGGAELLAAWAAVAAGDGGAGVLVDGDTGLPTALGVERVVGDRDGRVVVAHAVGWRVGLLPERAGRMLRRRIAGELRAVAAARDGVAFVCDPDTWGLFVASEDGDEVVEALLALFGSHRPGGRPIEVAIADGRARPGSASGVIQTLRRVADEATVPGKVSATEVGGVEDLGFLAGLQATAEETLGLPPGHGERCADLVAELLPSGADATYATLLARFHDIGGLGVEAEDDHALVDRAAQMLALLGGGEPGRLDELTREAIALAHVAEPMAPEERRALADRFPAELIARLEGPSTAVA